MQSATATPGFTTAAQAELKLVDIEIERLQAYRARLEELLIAYGAEAPASDPAPEPSGVLPPLAPEPAPPRPEPSPTYRDQPREDAASRRRRVRDAIAEAGTDGITRSHLAAALELAPSQIQAALDRLKGERLIVKHGARQGPKPGPASSVFYDIAYDPRTDDQDDDDVAGLERQIESATGIEPPERDPKDWSLSDLTPGDQILAAIRQCGETLSPAGIADLTGIPLASVAQTLQMQGRADPPLVVKTFNKWGLTKPGLDRLEELGVHRVPAEAFS